MTGVTSGDRFRSWPDIQANAARAADGFADLGIGEDESVALMLRNDFATFETNMAAGQLGAYAVPINWHSTAEEAGYILQDCGAKALVIHADLLPQVTAGVPAGTTVLTVPTPDENRRRLRRPGGEAHGGRVRDVGGFRGAACAPHSATQALAWQHDLYLGHDRPAEGRQAPALDA